MKIVVIGGGAAGLFTAINIAEKSTHAQVLVLEKTSKTLQKVKISGGGRCNVTNFRSNPAELTPFYPRGRKKLHAVFNVFSTSDMLHWLQDHGVSTHAEEDKRVFPSTNSSQTIIDCFLTTAAKIGVEIRLNTSVDGLEKCNDHWKIATKKGKVSADAVVFATGSSMTAVEILQDLGIKITERVPSLFTFNCKDERLQGLAGTSFPHVHVRIPKLKLSESGPLLITHKGLSGPGILKLSAWGAYHLHEIKYSFDLYLNFTDLSFEKALTVFTQYRMQHPTRKIAKYPLFNLTRNFWKQIINYCDISSELTLSELSKKQQNKLLEELTNGRYCIHGKNNFKEEFVTAGGVDLAEVNLATFESRRFAGLYFAGEVLNIDALTGGFNFQACWSAGWIISNAIRHKVLQGESLKISTFGS